MGDLFGVQRVGVWLRRDHFFLAVEEDLERQRHIVDEAVAAAVELGDRHAALCGLAQAHVLADHGVEDQVLVGLPDLRERPLGEARAPVEERRQQLHRQLVSEPVFQQADRLEQLPHAVHGVVAGLERNDHFLGGAQSVEGEYADVRRAVDEHEGVVGLEPVEGMGEPLGAPARGLRRQLLLERGKDHARGGDFEVLGRRDHHVLDR